LSYKGVATMQSGGGGTKVCRGRRDVQRGGTVRGGGKGSPQRKPNLMGGGKVDSERTC